MSTRAYAVFEIVGLPDHPDLEEIGTCQTEGEAEELLATALDRESRLLFIRELDIDWCSDQWFDNDWFYG